jgi:Tfp pilus assembly protein PilF
MLMDELKDFVLAKKHFEKALELDPNSALYNYNFAHLNLFYKNELQLARQYYNKAIELDESLKGRSV